MDKTLSHDHSNDRSLAIQNALEEYLSRRDTSAKNPADFLRQHPSLMPELGQALNKLQLIEKSLQRAGLSEEVDPKLPAAFGRYKLSRSLGRGGFADVYLGHDQELDCPVAIKVLRLDRGLAATMIDQVLLEARFYSRLKHPGILQVHHVGEQDGYGFIVIDFVDGSSLRDWLTENRPTWQQAVEIASQVADSLDYVHSRGIVHRDVKPANILLTSDFRPVLADMGLAVSASGTELHAGRIVGTPGYVAPEQARGERVDGRSDLYSLGAVLCEMLTGQAPNADDISELLRSSQGVPTLVSPQNLGFPQELEAICSKAMAAKIEERYATAGEMSRELKSVLAEATHSSLKKRIRKWIAKWWYDAPRRCSSQRGGPCQHTDTD